MSMTPSEGGEPDMLGSSGEGENRLKLGTLRPRGLVSDDRCESNDGLGWNRDRREIEDKRRRGTDQKMVPRSGRAHGTRGPGREGRQGRQGRGRQDEDITHRAGGCMHRSRRCRRNRRDGPPNSPAQWASWLLQTVENTPAEEKGRVRCSEVHHQHAMHVILGVVMQRKERLVEVAGAEIGRILI